SSPGCVSRWGSACSTRTSSRKAEPDATAYGVARGGGGARGGRGGGGPGARERGRAGRGDGGAVRGGGGRAGSRARRGGAPGRPPSGGPRRGLGHRREPGRARARAGA